MVTDTVRRELNPAPKLQKMWFQIEVTYLMFYSHYIRHLGPIDYLLNEALSCLSVDIH